MSGRAAATGRAVTEEDFVWSRTKSFSEREKTALGVVESLSEVGRFGVSFSGGKDSTVALHLVRRVHDDAPAALFDSGAEMASTLRLAEELTVEVLQPRMTMVEMGRYAGWWGYPDPVDREADFDAKLVLIQEPSEAFIVRERLAGVVYGLRSQESSGRARHGRARGPLWQSSDGTWYCQPLIHWDHRDVWAYIAKHSLAYNAAYDRMAEAGIPREHWRVSGLLGERGGGMGRHELARIADPEGWDRLRREFPGLGVTG